MPAEPVGKIRVTDFGGLDTEGSAWTVDPRDSVDCANVYTYRGRIIKRPAFAKAYAESVAVSPEYFVLDATGTYVLAPTRSATNRTVYAHAAATSTGAWTSLGDITGVGAGVNTFPVNYGARTIISPASTNGYFNGSALATLSGSPPSGSVALAEYNRMLFLSASAGGIANFSAIDSSDSWLSSDTLTHGTMAGALRGAMRLGSSLVVGGPGGFYVDSGYGRGTLRVDQIATGYSLNAFGNMAGGLEEVYAAVGDRMGQAATSYKAIVRLTDGGAVESVGDKIRSQFSSLDAINSPFSMDYDLVSRRLLMFSHAPTGGSATWWEFREGNWFKHTCLSGSAVYAIHSPGYFTAPTLFTVYYGTGSNYFASQESASGGLDFAAEAINAYWTTPIYRVYEEDVSDVVRWVYLFGKQTSGTNCTVEFQADNDGSWHVCGGGTTTYALQQNGVRIPIGVRCRTLQLRFTFGSTAVGAEIHGFVIGYTPVGNRA